MNYPEGTIIIEVQHVYSASHRNSGWKQRSKKNDPEPKASAITTTESHFSKNRGKSRTRERRSFGVGLGNLKLGEERPSAWELPGRAELVFLDKRHPRHSCLQ